MPRYAPYSFKRQDAFDFARFVGIPAYEKGGELFFKQCPICKGYGKANEKSFSINLSDGRFNCFRESCKATGNMITLSKTFDFSLGNEIDEYYTPKKRFKTLKTPKEPIKPKDKAIKFLESRGISESVAKRYEVTVQKEHDNILVFPFFDEKGILRFVKYRKTDYDKEKDSCKEWCEKDCKPILFGMKQCSDKFETLVINEGQMDSLSVAEAFNCQIDVVSVPTGARGFTWIPYCWDWINQYKEIIVFGDHEKGHITLLSDLMQRVKINVKHVREEDYKDCKDANEILLKYGKEQVKQCVLNAVEMPITQVVNMASVERVDIFKLEKLKTGLNDLDRLLYGGLPFGGVHLISGKPGEGKSTLASQIVINALSQGYSCFAYSGELPNYLFKAWMDFQICGRRSIVEYENKWGDKNYKISDANLDLISAWYDEKMYLYDSREIDGEETLSLVELMEKLIIQKGIRVFLLDNLMTAIDLEVNEGNDKYEKQSQFVKRLAKLSRRYDVLILLVAHKRKNNISTNANDEVAGSGDIPNNAMITIAYEKDKELDENKRRCKVSKNRLFGRVNNEGWILNYDEKSKRIYGLNDDVDVIYGWNKEDDGFMQMDLDEDVPF